MTASLLAFAFTIAWSGWGSPDLRPSWKLSSWVDWEENLSFLSDVSDRRQPGLLDAWVDPEWARDKALEYEILVREIENRRSYRISGLYEDRMQQERVRGFSADLLNQLRIRNVIKTRERAKVLLKNNVEIRLDVDGALRTSAEVAAFVVAAGLGTPFRAKLSTDSMLTAYANVPYRTSFLMIQSPLLNGAMTYVGEPTPQLPFSMDGPPDWVNRNERFSVSASRQLPLWDLGSSLTYGGSSFMFTSSITKQLTPHLSAAFDATLPADPERSTSKAPTQTIHVDYKLKF